MAPIANAAARSSQFGLAAAETASPAVCRATTTKAATVAAAIASGRTNRRRRMPVAHRRRGAPTVHPTGALARVGSRALERRLDPRGGGREGIAVAGLDDDLDLAHSAFEVRIGPDDHAGVERRHLLQDADDTRLGRPIRPAPGVDRSAAPYLVGDRVEHRL